MALPASGTTQDCDRVTHSFRSSDPSTAEWRQESLSISTRLVSTCSTCRPHPTSAVTMASWFQLKNLKQAVLPSVRAKRAQRPSAFTRAISSSGEYHSDRRGNLAMSSTPSSPMEIRANGQPVARMPKAVGTDRRTPMNVCWATADRCYWSRTSGWLATDLDHAGLVRAVPVRAAIECQGRQRPTPLKSEEPVIS